MAPPRTPLGELTALRPLAALGEGRRRERMGGKGRFRKGEERGQETVGKRGEEKGEEGRRGRNGPHFLGQFYAPAHLHYSAVLLLQVIHNKRMSHFSIVRGTSACLLFTVYQFQIML